MCSWHGVGKPLRELGGQGFWQPLAGLRRFPCAPPPPCLQESAEKPGDSLRAADKTRSSHTDQIHASFPSSRRNVWLSGQGS